MTEHIEKIVCVRHGRASLHWAYSIVMLVIMLTACNPVATSTTESSLPTEPTELPRAIHPDRLIEPKENDYPSGISYQSYGADLCADGVEVWGFDGRAGETVSISVIASEACKGPDPASWQGCVDSAVRVYEPTGSVLRENDNHETTSDSLPESMSIIPEFVLPATGGYRIEVRSGDSNPTTCDYFLTIERRGPEDTDHCPPPMLSATTNVDLTALKVGDQFDVDVTSQGVYPPATWKIDLINNSSDPLSIAVDYRMTPTPMTLTGAVIELTKFSFSWSGVHFTVKVLGTGTEEILIWENGKTHIGHSGTCDNSIGGSGVSTALILSVP